MKTNTKILLLLSFLVSNVLFSQIKHSDYLQMYTFLSHCKTDLVDSLQSRLPLKNTLQKAYQLKRLERSFALLEKIIVNFECEPISYNPEIEYRFFNICKLIDFKLKPDKLRKVKQEVLDFNQYLHKYFNLRKQLMSDNDHLFFKSLIEFNQILNEFFLNNHFFKINLIDYIANILIYRPKEFIENNPTFTVTIAATLIVCIYLYSKSNKLKNTPNVNDNISQIEAIQQTGAKCGQHSIYNSAALLSEEDLKKLDEVLNDKKKVQRIEKLISKKVSTSRNCARKKAGKNKRLIQRGTDWLGGGEIEDILKDKEIRKELEKELNISNKILNNILVLEFGQSYEYQNADNTINIGSINEEIGEQHISADDVQTINNETLKTKIDEFKTSQKKVICFIIKSNNHWFAAKFKKDTNASKKLLVTVADSLNYSRENDLYLNKIINWYNE